VEKSRHRSASATALPAIAQHEKALIDKERAAIAEAKQIGDRARAEAFNVHEECSRKINAEVATIKREGEDAREVERQRYMDEFERKLQAMREDAKKRAQVAIDAVIGLVLPKGVN